MASFDKNVYDNFLTNNDYTGLAKYLGQFHPSDPNQRKQLDLDIAKLKRYGGIANAILEKQINQDDKNAISFNMQREHGTYDGNNPYTKNYLDAINAIGNKTHWFSDDETASYFEYVFDNKDKYNKFVQESGIELPGYNAKDPTASCTYTSNGQPIIRVYRRAFKDGKFFDNLSKGLNSLYASDYDKAMWNLIVMNDPSAEAPTNGFRTRSFDKKGKQLTDVEGFDENQKKAWDYATASNNVYQKNIDEAYEKVVPSKLMVSGYLCGAQRQLANMALSGRIDPTTYNMQNKLITDYYDRMLGQISLTGYGEVFMTNPDNESQTLDAISDEDKGKWTEIMRTALKEGRVTYGAGSSGGRVGTVITISDKLDSKDEASSGTYGKGVQIFVPGLFDQDARELIDSDSNAKLQVELAEHQAFGHDYTLADGGKLQNFDGDGGATFTDGVATYRLSPEEVQQRMKKSILIDGGIDEAKRVGKFDENTGTLAEGQTDLVAQIDKYSKNVYAELNGISDDKQLEEVMKDPQVVQEIDNIFMTIMNQLGLNREGNWD